MNRSKLVLILGIVVVVGAFIGLDGHKLLTLTNLQSHQATLAQWVDSHLLLAVAGYMAIYMVVTALSLPGAVIMTLAGGAFLGNLYGLIAVSVASTVGASLAFLVARLLMRDTLRSRYRETVAKMDRGVE